MTVTDAIFIWVLGAAAVWLLLQFVGSSADVNLLVDRANHELTEMRHDLSLPSLKEVVASANSFIDEVTSWLGSSVR